MYAKLWRKVCVSCPALLFTDEMKNTVTKSNLQKKRVTSSHRLESITEGTQGWKQAGADTEAIEQCCVSGLPPGTA